MGDEAAVDEQDGDVSLGGLGRQGVPFSMFDHQGQAENSELHCLCSTWHVLAEFREALRRHPQYEQLRQLAQNPASLQQALTSLETSNPDLYEQITDNFADFADELGIPVSMGEDSEDSFGEAEAGDEE